MNNSLMVKVNETVSINHEIPSPTGFLAEKLYLGNFPTESNIPTTTTQQPIPTSTVEISTQASTTQNIVSSTEETSENDLILPQSSENPRILPSTTSGSEPRELNERFKREITNSGGVTTQISAENGQLLTNERHFKGVIQDIQISDGGNFERIVELFPLDFELVEEPQTIGNVTLHKVMKGVVSDNTCKINPCQNDGICQVTWNDYHCQCPQGYKGRNCQQKEFCFWYTCPLSSSQCVSLEDGHECISNATFNGVNASIVYSPEDSKINSLNADSTIAAKFRTKTNGTILHIVSGQTSIRLGVQDGEIEIEIPELDSNRIFRAGSNLNDGEWHEIKLFFEGRDGVAASIDLENKVRLSLDADLNVTDFVSAANLILMGAKATPFSRNDQYETTQNSIENEEINFQLFNSDFTLDEFFRGCMGEVRVGGILLPFFTEFQLINSTANQKFVVENLSDVEVGADCTLCYQHQCQNGGKCLQPNSDFECSCQEGFKDPICSTNIDECLQNLCLNGQCLDGIANYTCNCQKGWEGWLCDKDIDECELEPCQHGGTCQQTLEPGNYTCQCTNDYEGHSCEEVKVKTCAHTPCLNGGSCRPGRTPNSDDLYKCDCTTGYKGVNCEIKKDFCVENGFPCKNGADCVSVDSTFHYKCMCPPGFTGQHCEAEIDECASQPCLNGGKCHDKLAAFICDCANTGYSGQVCEFNIDECVETPCMNNGTCVDTMGDYKCECPTYFCGKNCQRQDPCQVQNATVLCQNGGVCLPDCDKNQEPFFKCECTEEWTGPNCSQKVKK